MELDFCDCITTHIYFKVFFVGIIGLVLTFAHEIAVLRSKAALWTILFVLLMMVYTHTEECGALVLLVVLFILSYNLNINMHSNNEALII